MSRSFPALRRLGLAARERPSLRGLAAAASGFRAFLKRGGIRFVDEHAILGLVLKDLGRVAERDFATYVAELRDDDSLRTTFDDACLRYNQTKYRSWEDRVDRLIGNVALYYALVRELRPSVLVETGTATGSMTSFLLAALHRNGHGQLISIDLPPVAGDLTMDITVPESEIGYWIPSSYRDRWSYRKGDAKVLLPAILVQERIDFFIHDSLHTRSHMLFEYAVARALMKENTVIVSDDILWNDGFDGFTALNGLAAYAPLSNPNIGVFANRFDDFERSAGLGVAVYHSPVNS